MKLFADCTDGLSSDIAPLYEAARRQNRHDIDAVLNAHRLKYGEPEQISFASCENAIFFNDEVTPFEDTTSCPTILTMTPHS